ncbi:MAG TPA: hypothetical protein DDZ96_15280 [Porphyromonadaceae bacterium]|jgi:hypothetical protein|nr:hypothetical protein [Porphyromonadaceae bacterium]HBL35154.1 hypothetical protein [Porphyromonadaceae bacterium]HBX18916.1 hypothetical protein [Porphyromonadaceae bacterium]HCM21127.1 hypothetical protein [Porphyromonadaceae bacterium]
MIPYGLVLSDDLQKAYLDFKNKGDFDQDRVARIFHYYKGTFLTNTAQLKRIGAKVSPAMERQLRGAGYTTQSLEDLAGKTVYKIILSSDKDVFPYVNIYDDTIENNLSGCFARGDNREKAIEHIRALCKNAKMVCLYDKYIVRKGTENGNQENLKMIASLFPKKALCIVYQEGHLELDDENFLKSACDKWTFERKTTIREHHDRYLIIDDKIEIILTSGFSSLRDVTKEFTYIIRPVYHNRFESL